jgi:hypothetical protein
MMEMNYLLIRTTCDTSLSVVERECEKRCIRVGEMTSLRFYSLTDWDMFSHLSQTEVRTTHGGHPFESADLLSGLHDQGIIAGSATVSAWSS